MTDPLDLIDRAQLLLWAYHPSAARPLLSTAAEILSAQGGGQGTRRGPTAQLLHQVEELGQMARSLERTERSLFPGDPWVLERTQEFACVVYRSEPYKIEGRIAALALPERWPEVPADLNLARVPGVSLLEGDAGAREIVFSVEAGGARGMFHFDRHGFGEGEFLALPRDAEQEQDAPFAICRTITGLAEAVFLAAAEDARP